MSNRLPTAVTNFSKFGNYKLITIAQAVHDGMDANSGDFIAPPILMVDLQGLIDTYKDLLATAFKGTKLQTSNKNEAKKNLQNALRAEAKYVNQIVAYRWYNYTSIFTYDNAISLILLSGFPVNKAPNPVGQVMDLIIQEATSLLPGELYVRIKTYTNLKRNIKTYSAKYRKVIPAVPPATVPTYGDWQYYIFTDSRFTITELDSGFTYQVQVAGIGGKSKRNQTTTNYTPILEKVII